MYVERFSTDCCAPRGEYMHFPKISKNGQTQIFAARGPEPIEMLLNMVFHIFVPISLKKYIAFLCFYVGIFPTYSVYR